MRTSVQSQFNLPNCAPFFVDNDTLYHYATTSINEQYIEEFHPIEVLLTVGVSGEGPLCLVSAELELVVLQKTQEDCLLSAGSL